MTASDGRIDVRDWSLLGVSVLWGGSFFFNGVVLRELPPLTLVLLRVALAAMSCCRCCGLTGCRFRRGGPAGGRSSSSRLFNNVLPFSLIVIGQTYIPSGLASILNATTPLFTVVVMAAAGEEKLIARRVAGVIVGLVGVVILTAAGSALTAGRGSASCSALPPPSATASSALVARRMPADSPPLGTRRFNCWPRA